MKVRFLNFLFNRNCKITRQSCHSPVFTRRPPYQDQIKIEDDNDTYISQCDSSTQPMALLSLDTNGVLNVDETQTNNLSSSSTNTNKRSLESPASEQVLIKRRLQKSVPSNFIF